MPQPQVGAPPGTLTPPPDARPTTIRLIDFGVDHLAETEVDDLAPLRQRRAAGSVTWIDVVGLADTERLSELGRLLGLTDLVLEDVLNVGQRPKFEDHDRFALFLSRLVKADEALEAEQVSLIFGERYVLSVQERPGDCFEGVRRRLRDGRKRIRSRGSDYLIYALVDALVDSYYPILKDVQERLEELEDRLIEGRTEDVIGPIHGIRRELRLLRRILDPTTDAVYRLRGPEVELVTDETRPYLADCWDHARRLKDLVDSEHELGSDLVDLQVSLLGHRMNEIMKVLTIFAAVFIPLTFIAGVYGMNFDPEASPWNMPELGWAYGYPVALGAMAATALALTLYFARKGWIGSRR